MKRLYVVGLGPGGTDYLTPQARKALEDCEVLCGYTTYMDLAADFTAGKELVTTPMTQELERCRLAHCRGAAPWTVSGLPGGRSGGAGPAPPGGGRPVAVPQGRAGRHGVPERNSGGGSPHSAGRSAYPGGYS